ncbi:MAG: hypothetical protein WC405_05810 [Syntrophales bacterium]
MEARKKLEGFGRRSLYFIVLFMVLLCMSLVGCKKGCADYEKELNRYADGSAPIDDPAKVLKDCKSILDKCPNLYVPFEVMGDIDAKNKKFTEAIQNYAKVSPKNQNIERVAGKIAKAIEALAKANETLFGSIHTMPLSKYAELDQSIRVTWCESLMAHGQRSGGPLEVIYSITPQQLDDELIRLAAKEPARNTRETAASQVMEHMTIRKR